MKVLVALIASFVGSLAVADEKPFSQMRGLIVNSPSSIEGVLLKVGRTTDCKKEGQLTKCALSESEVSFDSKKIELNTYVKIEYETSSDCVIPVPYIALPTNIRFPQKLSSISFNTLHGHCGL